MAKLTVNQRRHKKQCKLCKHPEAKEIERQYLLGSSPYELEVDFPGVPVQSIYNHAEMFDLAKKRDNSTLTKIRKILDRAQICKMQITPQLVSKCLELEAKISGELIERTEVETTINLTSLSNDELRNRLVEHLKFDSKPEIRDGNDPGGIRPPGQGRA